HVDGTALELGGPERERIDPENDYRLAWVPLAEVDALDLMPGTAREAVPAARASRLSPPGPAADGTAADRSLGDARGPTAGHSLRTPRRGPPPRSPSRPRRRAGARSR